MRKPRSREAKRLQMQRYRARKRKATLQERRTVDLLMYGLEFMMQKYFDATLIGGPL
jgi:hypothetical protein